MQLSVIIPTLGRKTLWWVLDHLTAQPAWDPKTCEALVVFDGQIIPKGHKIYPGVRFMRLPKQSGASAARNLGLNHAHGDIIAFLGDDTAPASDYLSYLLAWHTENASADMALLGHITWTPELEKDPFHQWIGDSVQFRFNDLQPNQLANWKYFYTANVSYKRAFIGTLRFNEQFSGWGFEDGEFAYRAQKKGMRLFYIPSVLVSHDHPQTIQGLIKNMKTASKNAELFESLHPVSIRPRGIKRFFLWGYVQVLWVCAAVSKKAHWTYKWKRAWLKNTV